MDKKELKELIDFMNEHNLCELEIEEKGKRVRLKKNNADSPIIIKENTQMAQGVKEQSGNKNGIEIKSPMVGTFYRAASPDAQPYVDIGSEIKPGDVVCIIEAMKLMNEIKSDVSGKIVEIPIENAEPVEFGQILLVIEPL